MKKNKFVVLFLTFFSAFIMINMLNVDIVSATTDYYEDLESGEYIHDGYLTGSHGISTWSNKNTLATGKAMIVRSDSGLFNEGHSLRQKFTGSTTSYWNFTSELSNMSFNCVSNGTYNGDGTDKGYVHFFANESGVPTIVGTIQLHQAANTVALLIKNPTHTTNYYGYMYWGAGLTDANYRINIRVINENYINISYLASDSWKIVNVGGYGYNIDGMMFQEGPSTYPFTYYYDDFDLRYNVYTGEGPPSYNPMDQCIDIGTTPWVGNGFNSITDRLSIFSPFIEFGSQDTYSLNCSYFAMLVSKYMFESDPIMNNYYLYLNGEYTGIADCFVPFDSNNYKIQWNVTGIQLNNERMVAELYHSQMDESGVYWRPSYSDVGPMGPYPLNCYIYFSDENSINGVLNGDTSVLRLPKWKLYFNNYTYEYDCPYENNINVIGLQPEHPVNGLPFTYCLSTVFFDCYVNSATSYQVHVYHNGTETGNTQGFPVNILFCNQYIGYTPYEMGWYNVTIETFSDEIVARVEFYVERVNFEYAIWTFPNPSIQSTTNCGVYINDGVAYDEYWIVVIDRLEDVDNFEATDGFSNYHVLVGTLNEDFEYFVSEMPARTYFRLFGHNTDTLIYVPLTSPYRHYRTGPNLEEYIETSLWGGSALIDEEFHIFGRHNRIGTTVSVWLGDTNVQTVDINFDFSYSMHTLGTYTLFLKAYVNGTWLLIDSTQFSIVEEAGTNDGDNIFPVIGGMLGYFIGAIISICLMVIPIALHEKTNTDIPTFVYVIFGIIGVVISVLLGFFPTWVLAFIVIVCAILLAIKYISSNGGGSA